MDQEKQNPWYKKLKVLDLSRTGITKVPNSINSMKFIRIINLSDTFITEIKAGVFENLPKLRKLNFFWNKSLTILHPRAFSDLPSLEILDLCDTGITEIQSDTFVNLPKLRKLDLRLKSWAIDPTDLSCNQSLTTLHPKAISDLPSLELINLSRNRSLTTLHPKAFSDLPLLIKLDLSDVWVYRIRSDSFYNLPKLIQIDILDNMKLYTSEFRFEEYVNLYMEFTRFHQSLIDERAQHCGRVKRYIPSKNDLLIQKINIHELLKRKEKSIKLAKYESVKRKEKYIKLATKPKKHNRNRSKRGFNSGR